MAFDAHTNLAISAVVTAPTPATSGTTLVVTPGEGARFPMPPFNATVWPATAMPTPLNGEVIRVTARTTDTLTITRAQEGSTARAIGSGDLIAATITAKTLTDLETRAALKDEANTFTVAPQTLSAALPELVFNETAAPADARRYRLVGNSQLLLLQIQNDAGAALLSPLIVDRLGDLKVWRDLYEKGRAVPLGHWIDIAFNPGNYTAAPSGTFAVTGHYGETYTLVGKTLTYAFYFLAAVTGAPTSLRIALPSGLTTRPHNTGGLCMVGAGLGFLKVAPSVGYLSLFRDITETVPWTAGDHLMAGTLAFGIT